LTKISAHTRRQVLLNGAISLPAVVQCQQRDAYAIYFSSDIAQTVPALIERVQTAGDELLDLRVERPSLEDRFLELTNS
jgi:ABC-2 type transport system ATP-binding protein